MTFHTPSRIMKEESKTYLTSSIFQKFKKGNHIYEPILSQQCFILQSDIRVNSTSHIQNMRVIFNTLVVICVERNVYYMLKIKPQKKTLFHLSKNTNWLGYKCYQRLCDASQKARRCVYDFTENRFNSQNSWYANVLPLEIVLPTEWGLLRLDWSKADNKTYQRFYRNVINLRYSCKCQSCGCS